MSNERNSPDMDKRIAETYKALATERAPDHLNEKVLAMAAREARTRYRPARTFIRPLAWAATIGLSLAIVLDLTDLPAPVVDPRNLAPEPAATLAEPAVRPAAQEDAVPDITAGTVREGKSAVAAPEDDAAAGKQAMARDRDVRRDVEARAEADPGPATVAAPPELPATDPAIRMEKNSAAEPVELRPANAAGNRADAVTSAPKASGDTARRRVKAEESLAATSFSAVHEAPWPESERPCPAALRESAESWLGCIDELRSKDLFDLADYETGEFERKYPSYTAPSPDK